MTDLTAQSAVDRLVKWVCELDQHESLPHREAMARGFAERIEAAAAERATAPLLEALAAINESAEIAALRERLSAARVWIKASPHHEFSCGVYGDESCSCGRDTLLATEDR